jgi:cell division control protein 6
MSSLFDSILKENESLFVNELALSYEFIPKSVPFREQQQKRIASCISPLFSHHTGRNIVVFGPPGVGKTVATKHLLKDLEEKTREIIPIYINCWLKNTSYKVALEMCELIDYKFTHNKKTDELLDIVANKLNKFATVFVFDEIDKAEDVDFLYLILTKIQAKAVILLTNYKEYVTFIDMRIRSRLTPEMLEFAPYTLEEVRGILKARVELAFVSQVFSSAALDAIIQKTHQLNDLRTGLYLLKEAGLCAQEQASKKVELAHATIALEKIEEFKIKNKDELSEDTQKILELIKIKSPLKIGDLYKMYQEEKGTGSYKTFTRKIAALEKGKFILSEKTQGGAEGNTSILRYNTTTKTLNDFS